MTGSSVTHSKAGRAKNSSGLRSRQPQSICFLKKVGMSYSSSSLSRPNSIPLLSSPVAQRYVAQRYIAIHTFLIPVFYYLRGSSLIADPSTALLCDLAVVATLQCAFCAVCLPQAGTWVSGTSGGPIVEGTSWLAGKGKGKSGAAGGTGSLRRKNVPSGGGGGGSSKGAGEVSWRARVMVSLYALVLPEKDRSPC